MRRVGVGGRVDGDGAQVEGVDGANEADGDLAAVGDEDGRERQWGRGRVGARGRAVHCGAEERLDPVGTPRLGGLAARRDRRQGATKRVAAGGKRNSAAGERWQRQQNGRDGWAAMSCRCRRGDIWAEDDIKM